MEGYKIKEKTKMFYLSDIFMGMADGETESNDDRFLDIFYTGNHKYELLKEKSKFIISGRKGTGKTVLAKYFQKMNEKENKLIITKYGKLKDLSIHELIEFGDSSSLKRIMIFNFQKFYIYKEIILAIKNNKKKMNDFDYDLRKYFKYKYNYHKLMKYFNSKYTNSIYESTKIEVTKGKGFENKLGVNSAGYSLNISKSHKETKKEKEFYKLVNTFENLIYKVLQNINILLIIDDFDDYFIEDKNDMIRFLIDFVNNVKEINNSLTKNSDKNRCIILMRNDVINSFASHDANIQKTLIDCQIKLDWLESKSQYELKDMVCNKIKNSNEKFCNMSIRDIENLYFPSNRISIKKKKKEKAFFNSIMELGFGRPRDAIVLFNLMVKSNPKEQKFSFSMIKESTLEYSNHIISELKNEMHFHLSDEYIEKIFHILMNFKSIKFCKEDIESFIKEHEEYKYIDVHCLLDNMYRFGIVGNVNPYGKRGKTGFHTWSYWPNSPKNINLDMEIIIHNGLHRGLNI